MCKKCQYFVYTSNKWVQIKLFLENLKTSQSVTPKSQWLWFLYLSQVCTERQSNIYFWDIFPHMPSFLSISVPIFCHKTQTMSTWEKMLNAWNGNGLIYLVQQDDICLNICPKKEVEAKTLKWQANALSSAGNYFVTDCDRACKTY